LKVVDQTEELAEKDKQIASLIDISDEKADWIYSLTTKLVEKDEQLDISKDKHDEPREEDSDEDEDEDISVDMGPPKQTLVNDLKGKDPCAKSVCTGAPICCNCCELVCCRCSRSNEWRHYPSGHMVPPPWNP
jgi:hypothetical protein